ncbi:MAG: quinone oxidoreductase [Betaproteobacteria bacterium]|jgi:NADPH2:quinone reductase|nr:quinone oxidoreductase [Betaproteobacteria bacterium]
MKALVLGADGPVIRDLPIPVPAPEQVLVRVHACGLNRADIGMAAGMQHGAAGGAGTVLGNEWAGEVMAVGDKVTTHRVGDRVMCTGSGGFAEYAVTDYGRATPISSVSMSYEQAATLPIALHTMHDAVVTHGMLAKGGSILIQGASSGVGLVAMQIAKLRGAALVIGSSTDAGRRAKLAEFGADLSINTGDPGWVQQVLEATGGRGVDLIIDQVAGPMANQNMAATRVLGRIVNVGRLGGMYGEFDFDLHALRRISYVGVTFRTRSTQEVRDIVNRATADLGEAVAKGDIRLPIDRVFPLADAVAALAYMKANQHFGKLVLALIPTSP